MSYYYDSTYFILIPGILIALWAQLKVSVTYRKYSKIRNSRNISGADAARRILDANGLYDVQIQRVNGNLTDHYDPSSRVLCLSNGCYSVESIAAISVAAHECGHAIQHSEGYTPLTLRTSLVPIVNFASSVSWILIVVGLFMSAFNLITLGILCFSLSVVFQLVTLPVEFNASKRAIVQLEELGLAYEDDKRGAKKMLNAAALTYVAALLNSILQLLRLIAIANRNRD